MKFLFTILTIFIPFILQSQTIATLEDVNVAQDSSLNGSNANGRFQSANAIFPNTYNAMFNFSSGWVISSKRDTVTSGFTNSYSAKAGSGFNGSPNYAVNFDVNTIRFTGRVQLDGFYATNSTYAYNSIRDGDQFAKRFGGETGNDPDFFRLHIFKYLNGVRSTDSVIFYLADYRFVNNAQDYIIKNWTWVNLAPLGEADSLLFTFASSDVGEFGINTPTYFCLDNLTTRLVMTDVNDLAESLHFKIYPNPTSDFVKISWEGNENGIVQLFDLNGKLVNNERMNNENVQLDLQLLPKGVYLLKVNIGEQFITQKIVKK